MGQKRNVEGTKHEIEVCEKNGWTHTPSKSTSILTLTDVIATNFDVHNLPYDLIEERLDSAIVKFDAITPDGKKVEIKKYNAFSGKRNPKPKEFNFCEFVNIKNKEEIPRLLMAKHKKSKAEILEQFPNALNKSHIVRLMEQEGIYDMFNSYVSHTNVIDIFKEMAHIISETDFYIHTKDVGLIHSKHMEFNVVLVKGWKRFQRITIKTKLKDEYAELYRRKK